MRSNIFIFVPDYVFVLPILTVLALISDIPFKMLLFPLEKELILKVGITLVLLLQLYFIIQHYQGQGGLVGCLVLEALSSP